MENSGDHRISTVEQLRAILGEPNPMTPKKLLRELDEMAIDFIQRSPFLVLGTADAEGNQDASPKGDGPGFVVVENENTLLIPDRRGNKLLFSLQNILVNPHVGIIFLIPGTDETLRVNGIAELTADPALLERLAWHAGPARDAGYGARMLLPLRQSLHPVSALEPGDLACAEADLVGEISRVQGRRRRRSGFEDRPPRPAGLQEQSVKGSIDLFLTSRAR